jgi:hypothetical protein
MILLLIASMVSHLTTPFFVPLDVRVGQTSGHTTLGNLSLGPSNAASWAIVIIIKVSNALSRQVVESTFPGMLFLINKFFHSQNFIQTLVPNFVQNSNLYLIFS